MSRLEVDAAAIEVSATMVRSTADEVRAVAQRVGGALQLAGGGGGSASFAAATALAARAWVDGLGAYADAGLSLSRATAQARLAYDMVELQASGRLTPAVRP